MAEFFIELFSEEIPARMQRGAAAELERAVTAALSAIAPAELATWFGPRRIALRAEVAAEVAAVSTSERGPRASAPEQALLGFLKKHNAQREQLRQEGDYWVLDKRAEAISAAGLIAAAMPGLLRRFPWPKSMRWGGSSSFVWVRPLRRIICLLDGSVVPFDLRDGADDGHGLASGNLTEGHRFHAPGAFPVTGAANWQESLLAHRVLVDAAHRKQVIADRLAGLAAEKHLVAVDDPGLLDEVAGLVEWPVPHLGRIADEHMDLPPEVMQVSMRVNQRYFALRTADGAAAPLFAFVANIQADDDGATIIAGNERVLRARFADARHFWDLDRRTRLADRVPALDKITFQAKLGTQGERVRRLIALAATIAPLVGADAGLAARAAELAKADLVSGMVGEFPELQGVMGRYYALHDGEPAEVADAIRDHYAPRGPGEPVPSAPVSVAVALADKLDQLTGFFAIGEKPTGSGDPYALRRAALGVIRIIRENGIRIHLRDLIIEAVRRLGETLADAARPQFDDIHYQTDVSEFLRQEDIAAVAQSPLACLLDRSLWSEPRLTDKGLLRRQIEDLGRVLDLGPNDPAYAEGRVVELTKLPYSELSKLYPESQGSPEDAEDAAYPQSPMDDYRRPYVHAHRLLAARLGIPLTEEILAFLYERLRVSLRGESVRNDILSAVFGARDLGAAADDLVALLTLTDAVTALLQTPDGANLLTAYRRAANILRIEERKDGPYNTQPNADLFREAAEIDLDHALSACGDVIFLIREEAYGQAMSNMSGLRAPLDAFFQQVTVNAADPALRGNRLRVLARVRSIMDQIADFSRIEG
jgi:glycyl-tRNA synthetase beta chain